MIFEGAKKAKNNISANDGNKKALILLRASVFFLGTQKTRGY
jgi:hypothetical protein